MATRNYQWLRLVFMLPFGLQVLSAAIALDDPDTSQSQSMNLQPAGLINNGNHPPQFFPICGTSHGTYFDDKKFSIDEHRRIQEIELYQAGEQEYVSSLRVHFEGNDGVDLNDIHGNQGNGVNPQRLYLAKNEYLMSVTVVCRNIWIEVHTNYHRRVGYLKFETNTGRTIERGRAEDKDEHITWQGYNARVAGFFGTSGHALDSIGARFVSLSGPHESSSFVKQTTGIVSVDVGVPVFTTVTEKILPALAAIPSTLSDLQRRSPAESSEASQSSLSTGVSTDLSQADPEFYSETRKELDKRQFGPTGGNHGNYWSDSGMIGTNHHRIASITLYCGTRVDAILFGYRDNRDPTEISYRWGNVHGKTTSEPLPLSPHNPIHATDTYFLERDEFFYLVEVDPVVAGRGFFETGHTRVGYIKFTTNKNHSVGCGTRHSSKNSATWQMQGYALLYCSGASGAALDNISGWFIKEDEYF